MKFTKKNISLFISCAVCSLLLSTAGASKAQADTTSVPLSEPVRIYGTLHKDNGRLSMTNIQGDTVLEELVLNVSDETRILDAVDGLPVSIDNLQEGELVYAYVGHAMTLSLPPQSRAEMIICRIPADFAAPSLETADALTQNADGTLLLTTVRGNQYKVDSTTIFLPYLTRNIVTVNDLTKGATCLVWPAASVANSGQSDGSTAAYKIVIFPEEIKVTGPASDPMLTSKTQIQ